MIEDFMEINPGSFINLNHVVSIDISDPEDPEVGRMCLVKMDIGDVFVTCSEEIIKQIERRLFLKRGE